jgi:8-oxo-dGTP pyrophosphatase MutT (NUDIX family)
MPSGSTVRAVSTWIEPRAWYANLPSFYAATAALITDDNGDILLVKPTYRDHWSFPGGYVDADEFPHEGCARELKEELGIDIAVGRLLVVDWAPPAGSRPRAIINFVFDGGSMHGQRLRLAREELQECAFLDPAEAAARLPSNVAPRIAAAMTARRSGSTAYLGAGVATRPTQ